MTSTPAPEIPFAAEHVTDRRAFIALLATAAAAPEVARAQNHPAPFTIGILSSNAPEVVGANVRRLEARLAELGFVEGTNVVYERRFASGLMDRIPALAEELVRRRPDLIVAVNNPEIAATKRLTTTIPIVMVLGLDAPGNGLVQSLATPGGNITGLQSPTGHRLGKRLQYLKETIPDLEHVAILRQRQATSTRQDDGNDAAARALGLRISVFQVGTVADFESAFAAIRGGKARAMAVEPGQLSYQRAGEIAAFALDARLPAIGHARRLAEQGLLLSHGPDLSAAYLRAADYAAKILRGARPADLPVEQSAEFELVVNLKTAERLGVVIPKSLLLIASDVIR